MKLFLRAMIFDPKSSNEDNFEPSRMFSSHQKPGKPGLGGLGYFEIRLFH